MFKVYSEDSDREDTSISFDYDNNYGDILRVMVCEESKMVSRVYMNREQVDDLIKCLQQSLDIIDRIKGSKK